MLQFPFLVSLPYFLSLLSLAFRTFRWFLFFWYRRFLFRSGYETLEDRFVADPYFRDLDTVFV